MTDNMISKWKDMMCALFNSIDEEFVESVFAGIYTPISVESFIENVLFEFCKYSYHKNEPKHPLRYYVHYDTSDHAQRMIYSRVLKYVDKYKKYNYSVSEGNKCDTEGLKSRMSKPMDTIEDRKEGHEIPEMVFFELTTIHDLKLVKAISEKRIFSSKKISVDEFIKIFEEYDSWVKELIERSKKSDEDMIFASLAFFTFEWKYAIEYYYNLTEYLLEQKRVEIEFYTPWLFTGTFRFESSLGIAIGTDSRMIADRIELIPDYFDPDVDPMMLDLMKQKYLDILTLKHIFMNMTSTEGGKYVDWFSNSITNTDIASFFRDYDVFRIWRKKEFDPEKIKKMRYVLRETSVFLKSGM